MQTKLIIDNEHHDALAGGEYERKHSVSGKTVTTLAAATVDDVDRVMNSSARAFELWSKSGPSERRALLLKAAEILEGKIPEFVKVMAQEVGASELWSAFNVTLAAGLFREAAGLATQIQGETIPTDKPGTISMTLRQPAGVVLSIAPWNGPVVLAARAIAYPLVCGNSVVLRASEHSPKTHMLLAEALIDAGLPAGVLNVITCSPADAPTLTESLIAHKAIRRVNFTGSTKVGRSIAEVAGRHLKRCLLELGGKAPFIVLADANTDAAVNAAVFGSFLYQGQICMSTERIVVEESIADEFVSKFCARAASITTGDPVHDSSCVVGPMVAAESGDRINRLIDDALSKGAVLVTGGHADGAVMPPSVLDHVTPDMQIYDEETFGPITTVVRATDVDNAIHIANDTDYGLAGSVFSSSVENALKVATELATGICHINGATVQNEAQAPYGGVKDSGYGRFDGRAVIDEFTELKWLTIEPSEQVYPV